VVEYLDGWYNLISQNPYGKQQPSQPITDLGNIELGLNHLEKMYPQMALKFVVDRRKCFEGLGISSIWLSLAQEGKVVRFLAFHGLFDLHHVPLKSCDY